MPLRSSSALLAARPDRRGSSPGSARTPRGDAADERAAAGWSLAAVAQLYAGLAASALAALDDYLDRGRLATSSASVVGLVVDPGSASTRTESTPSPGAWRSTGSSRWRCRRVALALRARSRARCRGAPSGRRARRVAGRLLERGARRLRCPLALQAVYLVCLPFAAREGVGAVTSFGYAYLARVGARRRDVVVARARDLGAADAARARSRPESRGTSSRRRGSRSSRSEPRPGSSPSPGTSLVSAVLGDAIRRRRRRGARAALIALLSPVDGRLDRILGHASRSSSCGPQRRAARCSVSLGLVALHVPSRGSARRSPASPASRSPSPSTTLVALTVMLHRLHAARGHPARRSPVAALTVAVLASIAASSRPVGSGSGCAASVRSRSSPSAYVGVAYLGARVAPSRRSSWNGARTATATLARTATYPRGHRRRQRSRTVAGPSQPSTAGACSGWREPRLRRRRQRGGRRSGGDEHRSAAQQRRHASARGSSSRSSSAARPGVGAACAQILHADGRTIWYAGAAYDPRRGHQGRHTGYGGQPMPREPSRRTDRSCLRRSDARSAALRSSGRSLDESLFAYAEDVDWSMRARDAGLRILVVPASVVRHRVSGSSGGASSAGLALLRACGTGSSSRSARTPLGRLGTPAEEGWRLRRSGASSRRAVRTRAVAAAPRPAMHRSRGRSRRSPRRTGTASCVVAGGTVPRLRDVRVCGDAGHQVDDRVR